METSSLTFAEPLWLLALIVIPIFAGLYYWSQRRSDALIGKIIAPRLREQLAGAVSISRRATKAVFILAAFALIAVALARPQKDFIQHEIKQRGRDVIIAIDTSRSMMATDVTPTRLARAKLVAQDILRQVQGDRLGLIAFAGSSFLQAPLTLDYNAVMNSLSELDTSIIPKGGTNIAAAINMAIEAFGKGEGQTRALIIMTDGEELDADGIAAAKKAGELGVRIFTVGIGSSAGSLIPIRAEGGGTDFVRDANGKPVQSRLDEARLKEIASVTGGFYESLGPDAAREIFQKGILPLETSEKGAATSRQPIERYQWPLGGAIALIILWLMLGEKRRVGTLRPARAAAVLSILFVANASAATGLEEYKAGHYDKAMAEFQRRLEASPESEQLQFDAGAASYKLGDYGKAVDHFTKALLSDDKSLREDASYNLGNSLVRRGEAAKEKDGKKSDWKNAIQHYTEALNIDPKNKKAQENRDIVKKLLEDLEKEEKKQDDQQKQDKDQQKDQNKDQQNKDQQNKDQQKQDQKNQQDQQNQKDQKQDQKNQQGQDQKDQQQKDQQDQQKQQGQGGQQDQKDQQQDKPDQQKGDQKPQDQKQDEKDQQQPPEKNGGDQQKDENRQEMANNQSQQQPATPSPTPGEKKEGDIKPSSEEPKEGQGEGQAAAGQQAEEKDGEMSAAQARGLLNSLRSDEERVRLMQRAQTEETVKDW